MKSYFIPLLILITLMFACDLSSKKVSQTRVSAKDTVTIDTIFLGFRFGMTLKEFTRHHDKLIKQKTITKQDGRSFFPMTLDKVTAESSMSKAYILNPDFNNDSLYKLRLRVEADQPIFTTPELIKGYLKLTLMESYKGTGYKTEDKKSTFSKRDDYAMRVGANLEISVVQASDHVLLSYLDINVNDLIKREKKNNALEEAKKTENAL
jgi:hypothetical protein